ncbi:hypothetical protein [Psychrobacter sp. Rd 27.2]|uniref:hypothetical protein n=1 Tax=Psychrobacter sp. Rd 27.2 TaxID=1926479 RepID=UPI000946B57D|nr:hypothetical protein [Psychrobacter sp. Rd 27.2]OLF41057.1 hypothetical protein BTV99_05200 [Psychrobacter sp. Rd 27.2]
MSNNSFAFKNTNFTTLVVRETRDGKFKKVLSSVALAVCLIMICSSKPIIHDHMKLPNLENYAEEITLEQTSEYLDRFMASQTVGRYVVNVRG